MPNDFYILDAHMHIGVQNVNWGWEKVRPLLLEAGIYGAAVMPPVEDIYDRYDREFADPPAWRASRRWAHQYLLELQDPEIDVFPYFFVWNDFAWEELGPQYVAIKWHRHPDEPEYHYEDPRCREFLQVVRERRLPIVLEETLENTLFFLDKLATNLTVIIPHLGGLSGGYVALDRAGVWSRPQVCADTALAAGPEIKDFIRRFGTERLIFGSDYPFGSPGGELDKIYRLGLPNAELEDVFGNNFRRLCRLD
jgi:hypothetical protein